MTVFAWSFVAVAFSHIDDGSGSEVSTEPSYILLNTAISSQWGFPHECPDNCECKKYDCHSNDYALRCGFSDGFCQMMAEDNPKYKIHYVRVYQNPDMPEQKIGCSTPERPTRRYIEAHEKLYKTDRDVCELVPSSLSCVCSWSYIFSFHPLRTDH